MSATAEREDSMHARRRLLRIMIVGMVLSASAQYAMAQLPGPFSFNFVTPFFSALFLAPFRLVGCA